jgi:hypothetical protein
MGPAFCQALLGRIAKDAKVAKEEVSRRPLSVICRSHDHPSSLRLSYLVALISHPSLVTHRSSREVILSVCPAP